MDAQLYIRDCRDGSLRMLTHPLSKYNGSIYVCCTYPMKAIIKTTCEEVYDVLQDITVLNGNLDIFLQDIKKRLDRVVDNNDILLYEIVTQYKNSNNNMVKLNLITMPKDNQMCTFCGIRAFGMKTCKECTNTYYCNRNCQKNDWNCHKDICKSCKFNKVLTGLNT
jgi:hypothetical protein